MFGDGGIPLCPRLQRLYMDIPPEDAEKISDLMPDVVVSQGFHYRSSCREMFRDEGFGGEE